MVATKTFLEDDVVISGMSGRFPECDSVEEFHEKLFSGTDLVKENDSRWPKGYLNTYSKFGLIKDLRNFDAPFFGAHPKLAERTDPIVRTLLETSVEAVMDAGICPTALRGSETGVIVAVSSNEAADWWSADPDRVNGYEFLGCTRTMYSNRISFVMDLKGPSYTMDSQSSSGLLGVQQAYYMLKTGMVDAVIVAGVNLVLNPHFNIMFKKLNMLSPEGKCKVFDADADGYVRSEAGVAILMQRKADAKRVYATIAGTESNCDGFKEYGCNTESLASQIKLYQETLERFHLNPLDVSFVEAHGYATLEGDRTELTGITEVFCKGRETPLLIGSVKTNMGHSEPVGGLVSVVKMLLAMENGILPPNLHFRTPNPEVPALKDGRLQVVDKLTVWNGKYAAVNSFGIGGTNSHLVLKRNEKEKKLEKFTIPRLMVVSGRTESAVKSLLNRIRNFQADNEFCSLLYSVFSAHIPHFNYRAFAVFEDQPVTETATYTAQDTSRPVCFVFSGMGSQWPGMCKKLLELKNFKSSIDACATVLNTVDFDLHALFSSEDRKVFDNVLNSFVGITCAQIAFVNLLYELGIKPDFIIGHSIGELACAYADETLTLEQTVLATYWRGKCLLMTELEKGAMAAVGLSANDVSKRLPADITIACHNSSDSVTISGPPKSINNFTKILQAEGIFAREVNSSGYAFHSQYIAKAGPAFKSTLEKIIPEPKLRTKRWISTSVPESSWNTPSGQYSSVAYHLNNLLSPVLFDKALTHIPENAVVIEISPHALLQSILKGSLSSNCTHVGLVRRNHASVTDLLTSIGRLYNAGLQPNLNPLYPTVNFPVSRKTPMIQSMIEWDHSIKWFLVSFLTKPACVHGEIEADVDITDRYKFLANCVIDELPTFPISGYICLIWEAVARLQVSFIADVPIVIENFQLLRKCTLSREKPLKFVINILESSGECEIKESGVPVARANIKVSKSVEKEFYDLPKTNTEYDNYLPLKPADFYLDLYQKGYSYKKEFRAVKYSNNKGDHGVIKWADNWMTYIEAMLQMHLLRLKKQKHFAISHIQKIIIDPAKHVNLLSQVNSESGLSVNVFPNVDVIKSGGIELRGVKSTLVSVRKKQPEPIVEYYTFIPHMPEELFVLEKALNVCTQLVCENSDVYPVLKTAEVVVDPSTHIYLSSHISEIIGREPYVVATITLFSKKSPPVEQLSNINEIQINSNEDPSANPTSEKYNFVTTTNIFSKSNAVKNILQSLVKDGFILTLEDPKTVPSEDNLEALNCKLIAKFNTGRGVCLLVRKTPVWKTPMVVYVKNDGFNWIDGVKMALRKHKIDKRNTIIIFHGNDPTGIVGFMKCVRREPFGTGLRCLFTDNSIQPYKIVDLTYINHFRKGMAFNVYKDGQWGSYRHLPVEKDFTVECEHAFIGPKEVGNFASLTYIEGRMPYINTQNYPNHELCYVYYSSIYAHDIRSALGHLPYDDYTNVMKQGSVLGHEYSGRDSKGKRVFGMVGGGALATTVLADCAVMWDVPDSWTLEQASTVPRVYSVAYYALVMRAQLQRDETVYINAGVMGLCIACVNVALGVGAIPFIGFNNQTEKKYLRDTFPELPETTFIDLEESSFEYQLLKITDGRGVDVIFDVLNSHKRYLFLDVLARDGRLVEFEKNTIFNESLGYAAVEKNITFHKISHNTLWVSKSGEEDRKEIQKLVANGVRSGVVKPILANIFTEDQVEEAFRAAQSGRFVGSKIVIKFRDEEPQKSVIPKRKVVNAYPSTFLDPEQSYIVTTGLSELGIQLIDWLISRGGIKIVVQSHYRPVTGYQCLAMRRWKEDGVNITLSNADASVLTDAERLIKTATELGPVRGIFHIGHVAGESELEECAKSHFQLIWKTKVETAKNLDIVSRKMCPNLKYFVGFSDVASCFGENRKCMFGYSCSEMEMVYERRKAEDYPSIVIQNGLLDKFDAEVSSAQSPLGFAPLKFSAIVKILPVLLNQTRPVVSVYLKKPISQDSPISSRDDEAVNNVIDILGIKSPNNKWYTATFEEIGIEPLVLGEIQRILNFYGVTVTKDEIKELSLSKVQALINEYR